MDQREGIEGAYRLEGRGGEEADQWAGRGGVEWWDSLPREELEGWSGQEGRERSTSAHRREGSCRGRVVGREGRGAGVGVDGENGRIRVDPRWEVE